MSVSVSACAWRVFVISDSAFRSTQIPEIKAVTNFYHIKTHYFTSHPHLNVFAIVPKCSDLDVDLNLPHDRDRFGPGFSDTAPVAN